MARGSYQIINFKTSKAVYCPNTLDGKLKQEILGRDLLFLRGMLALYGNFPEPGILYLYSLDAQKATDGLVATLLY